MGADKEPSDKMCFQRGKEGNISGKKPNGLTFSFAIIPSSSHQIIGLKIRHRTTKCQWKHGQR